MAFFFSPETVAALITASNPGLRVETEALNDDDAPDNRTVQVHLVDDDGESVEFTIIDQRGLDFEEPVGPFEVSCPAMREVETKVLSLLDMANAEDMGEKFFQMFSADLARNRN